MLNPKCCFGVVIAACAPAAALFEDAVERGCATAEGVAQMRTKRNGRTERATAGRIDSLQESRLTIPLRDPGSGVRDPGSGVRDLGSGVRDPGSGVRDPGSGIRSAGSGIRSAGSDVRDSGCVDPDSWIQRIPDSRIRGFGIRDQRLALTGWAFPPAADLIPASPRTTWRCADRRR